MIFNFYNQILEARINWVALKITELLVANYMTPYPISVNPDVTFDDAIGFMARKGFGNLIVSEDTLPVGILTEREILQAVALKKDTSKLRVKDLGTQPYVKITPDTGVLEAANTMISKKSRLLVFADDNKLVGIITSSDMLRAFRKTDDAPPLDKVFSKKLYRCSYSDTILDAVQIMHDKRIGSVIIIDVGGFGIFTERDLLIHVLGNDVDLNGQVDGYSSYPLIVADEGILGNKTASIMVSNNIKRLGLTKEDVLTGIVTARDLVDAFQSNYKISNPYLEQTVR